MGQLAPGSQAVRIYYWNAIEWVNSQAL